MRELENVIERSLVLSSRHATGGGRHQAGREPARRESAAESFLPDGMTLDEHEQAIIREALRRADGNKSQAARLLGLTRNALRYRLSQMGMDDKEG